MIITTQEHTSTRIPQGIIELFNDTHINWVSLLPGLEKIDRHIITHIGAGFDITIVEEDARLATLSNYLCPEATVVQSLFTTFLQTLTFAPTSRMPINYTYYLV